MGWPLVVHVGNNDWDTDGGADEAFEFYVLWPINTVTFIAIPTLTALLLERWILCRNKRIEVLPDEPKK